MTGALITVAAVVVLAGIIVFVLFYIGVINSYHPMKKPKENQIRIACVGDSITYGCMLRNRGKNNYPAVLNRLLGENYCVNNFGYTDRTAIKSGDLPYTNERLYRQSLDFNPNIVVFLLGSNDSKEKNWNEEKFIKDYKEILDSYLALDSLQKLYILIPPPLFEVRGKVPYSLRQEVVEKEIRPAIRSIAKEKGIERIDIYEIFKGRKDLFADGVHPNPKGSKLLAETVYQAIKK